MAAVRYAAPGGTGGDPCANPARPCSVFTAADMFAPRTTIAAGDVVELAPGTYHPERESEFGELGSVRPPPGVTVRGEPGKPRPVILLKTEETVGETFSVGPGTEVADVEIRNQGGNGSAVNVWGGTLNRVIARSTGSFYTCSFDQGTILDSACLNSGGGMAIGAIVYFPKAGTYSGVIRDSTLIATGPGSVAMKFIYEDSNAGVVGKIDALGVIARGGEEDVIAGGLRSGRHGGATLGIDLQASDYATVKTETSGVGRASVTRPGTNGNITAPPLLAADNLHQLLGSPTIDRGPADSAGDALDVDGQPRATGAAPDIGADEWEEGGPTVNPVPDTQLGKHPAGPTPYRAAEFTFGSSEPGSRFECKLDRVPFRACTSPYVKKVGLGRHRFQVRAIDPQGQTDRTPAVARWRTLPWRYFLP